MGENVLLTCVISNISRVQFGKYPLSKVCFVLLIRTLSPILNLRFALFDHCGYRFFEISTSLDFFTDAGVDFILL